MIGVQLHQLCFAFHSNRVGNQTTARLERLPAHLEHATGSQTTANEHRIRRLKAGQGGRCCSINDLQARRAQRRCIPRHHGLPLPAFLNGNRPGIAGRPHPLDRHRRHHAPFRM